MTDDQTLAEMAYMIGDELGVRPRMTIEPARVGEVTHYVANVGKARALLGYEPQVTLRDGIRRAVDWAHGYDATDRRTGDPGTTDASRNNPIPETIRG